MCADVAGEHRKPFRHSRGRPADHRLLDDEQLDRRDWFAGALVWLFA
jgi:hypothetical protein